MVPFDLPFAWWANRPVTGILSNRVGSSFPRLAAVALAVSLAPCVFPGAVRASCGDYVHVKGADVDPGALAVRPPLPAQRPHSPHPPCPCQGPRCSASPGDAPIMPPPVPPSSSQWALTT